MKNNFLEEYYQHQKRQKNNMKISNLNNILNKLENSKQTLLKQRKKSTYIGLTVGLITTIFLTILIFINSSITIPLFICNIAMGLICGLVSKIIYYKETTKELRELIKNNNPTDIKQEIDSLKEKTNTITPQTNFTKIKPCNNNHDYCPQKKIYQLEKK